MAFNSKLSTNLKTQGSRKKIHKFGKGKPSLTTRLYNNEIWQTWRNRLPGTATFIHNRYNSRKSTSNLVVANVDITEIQ